MLEVKPFGDLAGLTRHELREMIAHIETQCLKVPERMEIPLKHHFSDGAIYAREMFMPRGTLIVGKIHKRENLNIISQGEVSILSQDGVVRVKAPFTFVASKGAKRVIYAHTDVVWTTIHGTTEKDLDRIEELMIANTYEDLGELCLG